MEVEPSSEPEQLSNEAGEETDKEPDVASDAPPPRLRTYVHLACVHCKEKHATFAVFIAPLTFFLHSCMEYFICNIIWTLDTRSEYFFKFG